MTALDAQEVPRPRILTLFTVDACDVDDSRKLWRYRLQRHARRHGVPGRHHPLLRLGRLFTYRTTGIVCRKLPEALPMDGMATWHLVRGTTRTKQELLTDRTVRFVLSTLAVVVLVQTLVDAHATIMTMLEVLRSTHTAKTTVGTMVRPFSIRHP